MAFAGALGGCGALVPEFGEAFDTAVPDALIDAIVSHVHCEVKSQVEFFILDDISLAKGVGVPGGPAPRRHLQWLDDWGAQLSLTLTVEEKSTLSPGVMLNRVLPNAVTAVPGGNITTPQSESLALGASISAGATRKAVVAWFMDFREFTKEYPDRPSTQAKLAAKRISPPAKPVTDLMKKLTPELTAAKLTYERLEKEAIAAGSNSYASICNRPGGILIEGDLKFREWLYMTLRPTFVEGGVAGDFAKALQNEIKVAKKDVLQNQITFAVQYGGNATPSWKLVRVSANPSGPFLNAQRTRTQDLVVTLGPAPNDAAAAAQQKQQNQDLAAAIGIAVANAINSRAP
ncbi:hypothetical protein [Tardiphaga sp.]|jgi:hypothetical protein|uniref:hypothetical protein n=1 Tax=Tardiphaga sp. TaxID=1926292 RepID=UPI0037DA67CB